MIKRYSPKIFRLVFFCNLLLFASCSSRYRNALFTSPSDILTDTVKSVYAVNSSNLSANYYRIQPNDMLAIRNLQDIGFISTGEANSITNGATTFRVEADGGVILPLIGKVMVAGLSRKEATDKIQADYKKNLLKDPIIELTIVNLKVTLLGEFSSQGEFLLEDDQVTLVDIIGKAGGLSTKADPKTLKIIRGDRSNPEIIYVNLKNINSLASPKLILQNNDILYIEPLGVYNTSDRLQQATTVLQPILLVINFALIIYNFTR
jgi:polysaccharide export outer membrane protein